MAVGPMSATCGGVVQRRTQTGRRSSLDLQDPLLGGGGGVRRSAFQLSRGKMGIVAVAKVHAAATTAGTCVCKPCLVACMSQNSGSSATRVALQRAWVWQKSVPDNYKAHTIFHQSLRWRAGSKKSCQRLLGSPHHALSGNWYLSRTDSCGVASLAANTPSCAHGDSNPGLVRGRDLSYP